MDIISVDTLPSIQIDSVEKITMCSYGEGTNGSYDAIVLKYSPSGVLQWQNAYGNEDDDAMEGNHPCAVSEATSCDGY